MPASLQLLLERARSGDPVAREELLRRYLPDLRSFIRTQCGPVIRARESCSDLVQDVCLQVLDGLESFVFKDEASFRSWLFNVSRNRIITRVRFHEAQCRDLHDERAQADVSGFEQLIQRYATFCTPSRELGAREQLERIEQAFDELAPRYRQVIGLSRMVGLSFEEIGKELGVSAHYARTLLSRGLAQLLKILDEKDVSHGRG